MKAKHIIGIAWLLLLGSVAIADDETSWDSLDKSQQEVLAPFSQDWDSMTAQRRERLLRGSAHWTGMALMCLGRWN